MILYKLYVPLLLHNHFYVHITIYVLNTYYKKKYTYKNSLFIKFLVLELNEVLY